MLMSFKPGEALAVPRACLGGSLHDVLGTLPRSNAPLCKLATLEKGSVLLCCMQLCVTTFMAFACESFCQCDTLPCLSELRQTGRHSSRAG